MRESTPRTSMPRSLTALAREVLAAAEAAAGDHAPIRLRLGERQVGVRFDGPASTGAVLPAWRSLLASSEPTATADAEVFVATSDRSGPPPLAPGLPAPRRARTVLRDDDHELKFGGTRGVLSLWGEETRRGVWWTSSAEAISVADRILPLAPVLPSLLRSLGLTLARAGVVGSAKGGLLIVEASGGCCSATVLAARRRGLAAIADRVVALDPADLLAHPVTGFATVTPEMLRRMPELVGRLAQLPPTEDGRQAVVLDSRPLREAGGMPLRALVITEHDPSGTVAPRMLDDCERGASLAPAAGSLLRHPGSDAVDEQRLATITAALPAFMLPVGRDPDAVADALTEILLSLDAAADPAN